MNSVQRALPKLTARVISRAPRTRPQYARQSRRHLTSKEGNGPSKELPRRVEVKDGSKEADPVDIPSSLWYHRLGPVTDFFSWFHKTQRKRPLTVQLCTTLVTYLCGDILAQDIGGEPYHPQRTLRMLTIGALASIPGYKWFLFLGNHFNYASKTLSIGVKVCVQQAIFTPVFNTYFFGMQAALTGESPSGIVERVKNTVPTSMLNSLKLWPAVTAFSFWFIAPEYRFMFSGIFAVCWQSYLSFLNRKEERVERPGWNTVRALAQLDQQLSEQMKQKVDDTKETIQETVAEAKQTTKQAKKTMGEVKREIQDAGS